MANFVYSAFRTSLLSGHVNLLTENIKVAILNSNYISNENSDTFFSDIPQNSIEGISQSLSNKVINNGSFDADDITITQYAGSGFTSLVLYLDSGNPSTSKLIAYIDDTSGLPFVNSLNAQVDITIIWSDELTRILSI
jgi:hypothetical protein